jgi:hypothetical protein
MASAGRIFAMRELKKQSSLVTSKEVGPLGVFHLKRLWFRVSTHQPLRLTEDPAREWAFDKVVIYGLGLALEETLQYLARSTPTYAEFEQWVLQKNGGRIADEIISRINSAVGGTAYSDAVQRSLQTIDLSDPVLSAEDLIFWQENGYVKVSRAVSEEQPLKRPSGTSLMQIHPRLRRGTNIQTDTVLWCNSFTIRPSH